MLPRDLIQSYYTSLAHKDGLWKDLYAENAIFSDASKTLDAKGKDAVIQSFTAFLKGVENVKVKKLLVQDQEASVIVGYDYINPKGNKMSQDVAEIWGVEKNKLTKLTIYFDLTAYRNFMRS